MRVVAAMARGLCGVAFSVFLCGWPPQFNFFNNTAVADKQCGGLQTRVDVGALPTRRANFKVEQLSRLQRASWKLAPLFGPVVSEDGTAVLQTAGDGASPSGSAIFQIRSQGERALRCVSYAHLAGASPAPASISRW